MNEAGTSQCGMNCFSGSSILCSPSVVVSETQCLHCHFLVLVLRIAEATGSCHPIDISSSDPIGSALRACSLQFDNSDQLGDKGEELDIVIHGEERPWTLKENVVETDRTMAAPWHHGWASVDSLVIVLNLSSVSDPSLSLVEFQVDGLTGRTPLWNLQQSANSRRTSGR